MRIGSLVMWAIKDADCYGCLGVVCKMTHNRITIQWSDGLLLDYAHQKEYDEFVEVICE